MLFYKNFYIYGNLDYDDASTLKSYFFGIGRHPNHLTYADKYSDFRKCTLDNREGMQQCRYGLVNLAKETKNVLMGVLGEEKGSEKFMPYVYFPKKECFEIVRSPQKSEEMKFDLLSLEIKPDNEQGKPISEADNNVEDGLVKYKMCLFKVGNFMLPILTKPNNTKIEEQFNTIKNQLKSVLEHCEKMILNQLSLVESSLQKKSNILSSIIYNEVNRSVVYYPFSKFSLANLPAPMIHLATRLFTTGIDQPSITEIECQLDGYHFALTKWNQRTILVIGEDKKMSSKDFHNHLATFRTGLTDIFI